STPRPRARRHRRPSREGCEQRTARRRSYPGRVRVWAATARLVVRAEFGLGTRGAIEPERRRLGGLRVVDAVRAPADPAGVALAAAFGADGEADLLANPLLSPLAHLALSFAEAVRTRAACTSRPSPAVRSASIEGRRRLN